LYQPTKEATQVCASSGQAQGATLAVLERSLEDYAAVVEQDVKRGAV